MHSLFFFAKLTSTFMRRCIIMRVVITTDDVLKLNRAYEDLSTLIELSKIARERQGLKSVPSSRLLEAHRCLEEVLFSIDD